MEKLKNKILWIVLIVFVIILSVGIFAQTDNSRIQKPEIIKPEGEKVVFGKWGDKPGEFSIKWEDGLPFTGPEIVPAVDKNGNVYIYDVINKRVSKFSKEGKLLLTFNLTNEQLKDLKVIGIAMDKSENLYIGNLVFSKEGKLIRVIKSTSFTGKGPFILMGVSEKENLLIKDVDPQVQHVVSKEGKTVKIGTANQAFTPIGDKNYSVSFIDKSDKNTKMPYLKITNSNDKDRKEEKFLPNSSLLNNLKVKTLNPIKISKTGELIITARRQLRPLEYFLLYLNQENSSVTKAYVLPDEEISTENPPVFGLDGNIYQSGFILGEDGGYWVKKFEIPDEDKPRW